MVLSYGFFVSSGFTEWESRKTRNLEIAIPVVSYLAIRETLASIAQLRERTGGFYIVSLALNPHVSSDADAQIRCASLALIPAYEVPMMYPSR